MAEQKSQYTFYVGGLAQTSPWIYIFCNEEDTLWEPETFTEFLKQVAGAVNNGAWYGNAIPAGYFPEDCRYRVKSDPLMLVYQYDTLYGIVVEYSPGLGADAVLNYLENVVGIQVDPQYRQFSGQET